MPLYLQWFWIDVKIKKHLMDDSSVFTGNVIHSVMSISWDKPLVSVFVVRV